MLFFLFQTYTHFLSVTSHLLRRLIIFRIIVWVLGTLCQIMGGFSTLAWVSHLELKKKISSPGPIQFQLNRKLWRWDAGSVFLKLPWWLQYATRVEIHHLVSGPCFLSAFVKPVWQFSSFSFSYLLPCERSLCIGRELREERQYLVETDFLHLRLSFGRDRPCCRAWRKDDEGDRPSFYFHLPLSSLLCF